MRRLPEALLAAGLADGLGGARRAARVVAPPSAETGIDETTGVLHGTAVAAYARMLAPVVEAVLDSGDLPLVLGGDCSILLGSLLALRGRGRRGLLFVDGHADFYDPASEPAGEAASMELALATGRGPAPLADLDGRGALVRDDDVVVVGVRDQAQQREYGSPALPEAMLGLDLVIVRERGIHTVASEALARLTRAGLEGFWIHVDADVLDDAIMPAVDYRLPGGLGWAELSHLLSAAMATGRVTGVEVAILNPELDPTGDAVRGLVDCLTAGLRP